MINIKTGNTFMGNLFKDAIWSKVDYLISNFSPKALTKLRPSGDATFSSLWRFWIYDTNKRKKRKKSKVLKLKDFVIKYLYFHLDTLGYFVAQREAY